MTVESVQPDLLFNPQIYGPQTNVHILEYMEVIDLLVKNSDTSSHPCQLLFFSLFFCFGKVFIRYPFA